MTLSKECFKKIGKGSKFDRFKWNYIEFLIIGFGQIVNQPIEMSLTISVSMIFVIIVAALIGTAVPIILDKLDIDPAIATGPFITTGNDVIGILLFFYTAKIILGF